MEPQTSSWLAATVDLASLEPGQLLVGVRPCSACAGKGVEHYAPGNWLRALRVEAGLSGVELAALMGYSTTHVSDIENDRRRVSPEYAEAFVGALRKHLRKGKTDG